MQEEAVDESACEAFPDIPVAVTSRFDTPAYNYVTNLAGLQALSSDPRHSIREALTMGLTRYEPVLEFRAPLKALRLKDGLACARVDHVDVSIGYRDVTVYVASEIPQGTCGFDKVLEHEQKHIAVNRQILAEYAPQISERLRAYLKVNGLFREENPEYALTLLKDKLQTILDEMATDVAKENHSRQQAVDNPEEYRRIAYSCNGELENIAMRFVHKP